MVIIIAEVLTTLFNPLIGLVVYGLILFALLLHTAFTNHIQLQRFLLALSLIPLTRLLSMMLPLYPFLTVHWYPLIGVPLYLAAFYVARIGRMNRVMIGITARMLHLQVLVSLTGIGLGYLEYLILRPEPLVKQFNIEGIWFPALILLIFTGLQEELIFRGLLQYAAVSVLGQIGMIYMALVFAVMHLGYRSWLDLIFVFAVALFFGWVVRRSGSILGVALAHGLTNICLFLIFPFLPIPARPATPPWLEIPHAPFSQPTLIRMTLTPTPAIRSETPAAPSAALPFDSNTALTATPLPATFKATLTPSEITRLLAVTASPFETVKPTDIEPAFSPPFSTRGPFRQRR